MHRPQLAEARFQGRLQVFASQLIWQSQERKIELLPGNIDGESLSRVSPGLSVLQNWVWMQKIWMQKI